MAGEYMAFAIFLGRDEMWKPVEYVESELGVGPGWAFAILDTWARDCDSGNSYQLEDYVSTIKAVTPPNLY